MLKKVICGLVITGILAVSIFTGGCDTAGKSGTLIGAGAGALAGQAIGHNTTGTLIGTGVGALGGYIVGNEMDKSNAKKEAAGASGSAPSSVSGSTGNSVTVWLTNTNGSQTPVKLTRNADGSYTGPKGERYSTMPTEEQLKSVYGL